MAWVKVQLRQILRSLGRASLFTAVALLTLAVGIGSNAAIFSVVNGILLKPLPYPHPEQLVAVWLSAPGINIKDLNLGLSHYLIFREQNRTFQDIGLYMGYTVNITGRGGAGTGIEPAGDRRRATRPQDQASAWSIRSRTVESRAITCLESVTS